MNPQTIHIDGYAKIDYSNQRIAKGVPEDWLSMPGVFCDCFKVYVNHMKEDRTDMNILTVYVFNKAKKQLGITACKSQESETYVKIDGETKPLNGLESDLGVLDLGLHKLEVYTGTSSIVDFKGFIIN